MSVRRADPLATGSIFAWPLAIAVASIVGLILGLTGEGWRDALACLLLSLIPFAILAAWLRRSR